MNFNAIETIDDILRLPARDQAKFEAMVETDTLGRRWLMGFKRKNAKRSRKGRVVWLATPPINLTEVNAAHEKLKASAAAAK